MSGKESSVFNNINIRMAVSPACNLDCTYCDGPKSRAAGKPGAMEDYRHKPLEEGIISTENYLAIVRSLRDVGFSGLSLTGGEPMLNPDWDYIVNEAARMGMERIEITTNGTLLLSYLKHKRHLPEGLTLLKVSFDTDDSARFLSVTGSGDFFRVLEGIKAVKAANPNLTVRANKVILRSDLPRLESYIRFCEDAGIDQINMLDLVFYNPEEKAYFEQEFISAEQLKHHFEQEFNQTVFSRGRYGYYLKMPSGLQIILKDSDFTLRNHICDNCPVYCQEGLFTVRIATDGSITTCPDKKGELPFIDGLAELQNGTLDERARELSDLFTTARRENTHRTFLRSKNLEIR